MKFYLYHWQPEEKVEHLNLKVEETATEHRATKYSIEINSLEELVTIAEKFDIMFSNGAIMLDDKNGRFRQR